MLKKFMIEKVDEEQFTETTGRITFHLVDENGNCRKVKGSTHLDENQKARGITTESVRELPLIETLFSNRKKKFIEVEFDPFNKVYDRETDQTVNQIAYQEVVKMQKEKKLSNRISSFFKR